MSEYEVHEELGRLSATIQAVNERLTEHMAAEEKRDQMILERINAIHSTLAEAKGAQRFFVWMISLLFAGIAAAKGWISIGTFGK